MNLNSPTLLDRLFRRSSNPFVAKVHAHAIGQPLMVHPSMGEQLIGAFLSGAIDTPPELRTTAVDADGNANTDAPTAIDPEKVVFLNISGALVNRPMPDICGAGPVSYVAIRRAFDAALADGNVQAIVLRMNSPGGMASGLFDLSDHIYASRGTKPIIALVDDVAYSACYGIAAACDEIWVSRTGGVGSVGVVCYHVDQSAADQKAGLRITPIYAGDRKVDFSPHAPLSESALAEAQAMCDEFRELFVTSVATYRGLDPAAVLATEAGTFRGQAGIDAGFATHLGTMHDLLAALANPAPPADESTTADAGGETDAPPEEGAIDQETTPSAAIVEPKTEVDPETMALIARGRMAEALKSASLPAAVTAALVGLDATARPPAELIADAAAIVDLCVATGCIELAAELVASGATPEQARTTLAAARAAGDENLVTTIPVAGSTGVSPAAGPWGETIKKFGG